MARETVKVRLRRGDAEVEVEGSRTAVDELLARWWEQRLGRSTVEEADERPARGKKPRPNKRSSAKRSGDASAPSLDPNEVANAVKESKHFSAIEAKILHAVGDNYHKVAFVLWFTEKALTSGDIFRVLKALDVRILLPNVSSTLKANLKHLTTDKARKQGGAPAAYRLTAKAKSDFEKWLHAVDE